MGQRERERKKKWFKLTMIYFIIDLNVTIVSHKDTEWFDSTMILTTNSRRIIQNKI